ncbi:MAG TPA: DUF433 domain-containing protein [Humisphaera sp.]
MTTDANRYLGVGLYTAAEAAMYAHVPVQTMSRWLFGNKKGEAVLRPQMGGKDRIVTFLDFVQSITIRQILADPDIKLSLDNIRRGIEVARETYGVEYPLATEHRAAVYGDKLLIRIGGEDDDEEFVQVSGREAHHKMIQKIVRVYMKDFSFGPDGLASVYTPFRHEGVGVSLNPQIRFGEPLVPSCGYSVRTLWGAARAEGSLEAAAKEYGVRVEEVEAAYRYYESLRVPKAA